MLFNINNINNNDIHNDIKNIINEKNIKKQYDKIMNIYALMNEKDNITIIYKINEGDKEINIFGSFFVKNNKDKCKYIYDGKEYELSKTFDLSNYNKSNGILEIKLIGIKMLLI